MALEFVTLVVGFEDLAQGTLELRTSLLVVRLLCTVWGDPVIAEDRCASRFSLLQLVVELVCIGCTIDTAHE